MQTAEDTKRRVIDGHSILKARMKEIKHKIAVCARGSPASKAFMKIVEKIETYIQEKNENQSPSETGDE